MINPSNEVRGDTEKMCVSHAASCFFLVHFERTITFLSVDGRTEHEQIYLGIVIYVKIHFSRCCWFFVATVFQSLCQWALKSSDESVLLTVVSNQNLHGFPPGSNWIRLPIDRNNRKKIISFLLCVCSYRHNFKHMCYSRITESTESDDSFGRTSVLSWTG